MNRKRVILVILIVLSFQTGCLYAVRYDGPYHGKVVDEQTREPIEGAVVLGQWGVYHFGVAGGYTTFYDAREAVTDKNGEFMIPGQGLRIMTSVGPMGALIYKAGYTYYTTGSWDTLKTGMFSKEEVKWEGDLSIFPLRKLTESERKKDVNGSMMPLLPSVPWQKMISMTREVNNELIFRGLQPYNIGPSKKGEDK